MLSAPPVPPSPRLLLPDVLRGLALLGIAGLNAPSVMHLSTRGSDPVGLNRAASLAGELFLRGHFFPIFSLLFGVSFAVLSDRARERGTPATPAFLRRLAVLAAFGLVHQQFQPGEVLLPYAVFGLLLLPFRHARPGVALAGSALITLVALWTSPVLLTPAMFLLGLALHRLGAFQGGDRVRAAASRLLPALVALGALFTAAQAWLFTRPPMPVARIAGFDLDVGTLSGLVGAAAITCAAALLTFQGLTFRGAGLLRLLVPLARLGRMSLSSYILQTLVFVALAAAGWRGGDWALVIPASGLAILVNFAFSCWWLSRFRTGPLEFLLRWGSDLRRPAIRLDLAGS